MAPLIIIGVILFIGAIIALAFYLEKKRTDTLRELAESLNFSFAKKDPDLRGAVSHFHLFSKGHGRKVKNAMQGDTSSVNVAIFDYQYTTGSGKNSSTHSQTVIAFQSPDMNLPAFTMRPEHVFDKLGDLFGHKDIDFNSHPDFSKHYLVKGENEEAIRDVFTYEVLDYYQKHRGVSSEGKADRLIFYRAGKRVKPAEIRTFMEDGFAVFNLFKGRG